MLIGIGAVLVCVLLFVVLGLMTWGMLAMVMREKARQIAHATPATARVVKSVTSSFWSVDKRGFGEHRLVSLTLEVFGPRGTYTAWGKWDVQLAALPRVAPEQQVAVLINPAIRWVIYPAEGWARATELTD